MSDSNEIIAPCALCASKKLPGCMCGGGGGGGAEEELDSPNSDQNTDVNTPMQVPNNTAHGPIPGLSGPNHDLQPIAPNLSEFTDEMIAHIEQCNREAEEDKPSEENGDGFHPSPFKLTPSPF